MYSDDDRLRAVQLHIQLVKGVGLTIHRLGYPTKNAPKTWYREYERRLELPVGYVRPLSVSLQSVIFELSIGKRYLQYVTRQIPAGQP
jgi:hypothetical protein